MDMALVMGVFSTLDLGVVLKWSREYLIIVLCARHFTAFGGRCAMQINRCPKCGREPSVYCGTALLNGEMRDVNIECDGCRLYTGNYKTHAEAVAKWNEMTKGINK